MTQDTFLAPCNNSGDSRSATSTPPLRTPPSEASGTSLQPSASPPSRRPSPLNLGIRGARPLEPPRAGSFRGESAQIARSFDNHSGSEEDEDDGMEDGPTMHRATDARSGLPLLKDERGRPSYDSPNGSARPTLSSRRSTFRSRSPELEDRNATKKKYTYAAFFLGLSLISFVVQTETAVYIQHELKWNKAYCML